MQLVDFFDRIEAHAQLEGLGFDEEAVYVRCLTTKLVTRLPLHRVGVTEWEELERILSGGDTKVLVHMTRIVGYYSRLDNWNASKLGELKDRHRGNYLVAAT